jgi:hypothetical protein
MGGLAVPRPRAGQPMNADTLATQVNDISLPTTGGRVSAIRRHVLDMPSPVVADALGYHPVTTAKLAAQAGGAFSRYAPGDHTRPDPGAIQAKESHDHPLTADRTPGRRRRPLHARSRQRADHRPRHLARPRRLRPLHHHGTGTAAIDWEAAIAALGAGELPSSGGEKQMLRLAASLAGQAPVSLGEAITGIDDRSVGLVVKAILHASGQREFPSAT